MNHLFPFLMIAVFVSCGNKASEKNHQEGKRLYKTYCSACHGENGKLKLNNAADLSLSEMNMAQRVKNITEGGEMMPAFGSVISEQEIALIAAYLDELKN